jgi:hypothetical protein
MNISDNRINTNFELADDTNTFHIASQSGSDPISCIPYMYIYMIK